MRCRTLLWPKRGFAGITAPAAVAALFVLGGIGAIDDSFAQATKSDAREHPKFISEACGEDIGIPGARCGRLEVYENRAAGSGRKISLRIAVAPALGPMQDADPLFFIAGGPGSSTTDGFAGGQALNFLNVIRERRDVVLVDQRGTGGSHKLPCKTYSPGSALQDYFDDSGAFLARKAQECREALAKDADLTQYTTLNAADDLDDVRDALGYGRINLLGFSYGSRVALVYARRHPAHLRSMILNGVDPPSFKLPLGVARGAQHAFDRLFDDCAAQEACRTAYPNLRAELTTVLDLLEKSPAKVQVKNPTGGRDETVVISRGLFAADLGRLLPGPGAAVIVPFLIHQAARGEFSSFVALLTRLNQSIDEGIEKGMYLSVLCSEDVPWISDEDIARATAGTFIGPAYVVPMPNACKEWPRGKISKEDLDPVVSNAPALLLSGDLDPSTPAWIAAEVAQHLANSRHLIAQNGGHTNVPLPCLGSLVTSFLEAGSANALDGSCMEAIRRPPFIINLQDATAYFTRRGLPTPAAR